MSSQYPPVKVKDAISIALAWGWVEVKGPRTKGDHKYFEHPDFDIPLQIDTGAGDFGEAYIRMMIKRMGIDRKKFYGATKRTAKKIGIKYDPPVLD
ncbi:MAG: hypothetical protein KAT79_01820 [candidate division Zixibacteria bacterium]|nr:hypothetical protein [candidate division Zixibacteria bacterium]